MGHETYESECIGGGSSYQGNPIMFIVHARQGYMFGAKSETRLKRVCGADSKSVRAQVNSDNEKIVDGIVSGFAQAFTENTQLVFTGHSRQCSDIAKIEILDGNRVGKSGVLATVYNPNISPSEEVGPMAE